MRMLQDLTDTYGNLCVLSDRTDIEVNAARGNGDTPIHLASFFGHEAVVRMLLAHPDLDLSVKNLRGLAALDFAEGRNQTIIRDLLRERVPAELHNTRYHFIKDRIRCYTYKAHVSSLSMSNFCLEREARVYHTLGCPSILARYVLH